MPPAPIWRSTSYWGASRSRSDSRVSSISGKLARRRWGGERVAVADEGTGDAHPAPLRRELHAHRGLEPRLGRAALASMLDASLFRDEQRVHEAHRLHAHRAEQPLDRRDLDGPRRRFVFAAIGDLDRLYWSVHQSQRPPPEPPR